MRLMDRVALITGGTSGIGEATALLFAREGARVAITGRNKQRGTAVLARMEDTNGKAIFLQADMSVASECERVVDETVRAFGRIDILFNNAGVFYPQTALECSEREWDEQIDVNLKGTFLMSKYRAAGNDCAQEWSNRQQRFWMGNRRRRSRGGVLCIKRRGGSDDQGDGN